MYNAFMTVNELIAKLSKIEDKNLEVLVGDNDYWFYDTRGVSIEKVSYGKIDEEKGEKCVVIK